MIAENRNYNIEKRISQERDNRINVIVIMMSR